MSETEDIEEAIETRRRKISKPKDALEAKALIALYEHLPKTKQKYYDDLMKKAQQIVEGIDEVMRVFVAEVLREDYMAPVESDSTITCDYCDIARDEMCTDECTCHTLRLENFAYEIGAYE